MARRKEPETLEEISAELEKSEKTLRYWKDREKILKRQVEQLTRKERTHRLCTRGGMLEAFLLKPEKLSDDQVMEILKYAFHQQEVDRFLKKLLEEEPEGKTL